MKIFNLYSRILIVSYLILIVNSAQTKAWSYAAIPYTDWAYDPFTLEPTQPTQWPSSAANNYYYVEPNHPSASDQILAGELTGTYGRFGYPDRSRLSIPSNSWIGDIYNAGTVIWLKGGEFNSQNFYPNWSPQLKGTESQPVWLYGDPEEPPVFSGVAIQLYNMLY